MARKHARLCTLDRTDPEWHALDIAAQWLYVTLLRQPRLTLAGTLDLVPARWAATVSGTSGNQCDEWLNILAFRRFVIVDRSTSEVLVRTFTRHDLDPGRLSPQVAKGLWSAWDGVMSPVLRAVIVQSLPDAAWVKVEPHASDGAKEIRRSAPIEWESLVPVDCPVSYLLPPVSCPPSVTSSSVSEIQSPPPAVIAETPLPKLTGQALEQATNRSLLRWSNTVAAASADHSPSGFARTLRADAAHDGNRATLEAWIADGMDPDDAADRLAADGGTGNAGTEAERAAAHAAAKAREQATTDALAAIAERPTTDHAAHIASIRGAGPDPMAVGA